MTTYYVKTDGNDGNTGLSWEQAFATINQGLQSTSSDGDTVVCKAGTYTGAGNKDITWPGRRINLISETYDRDTCIIDCESTHRFAIIDAIGHDDSYINGFTIKNGQVTTAHGGGIYGVTVTVTNCIIESCSIQGSAQDKNGGGIRLTDGTISNCIIRNNTVIRGDGGGIDCNGTITDCTITGNTINDGDGAGINLVDGVIDGCTISSNDNTNGGGGGISIDQGIIKNSFILENTCADTGAQKGGGGIRCKITGAISIINCVIADNEANMDGHTSGGGGIKLANTTNLSIVNCTIANNEATCTNASNSGGGGIHSETSTDFYIDNTIIWGNRELDSSKGHQIYNRNAGGNVYIRSNCFENITDAIDGDGAGLVDLDASTIYDDPVFVGSGDNEYSIQETSPCIGVGENSYNSETYDIIGNDRIV